MRPLRGRCIAAGGSAGHARARCTRPRATHGYFIDRSAVAESTSAVAEPTAPRSRNLDRARERMGAHVRMRSPFLRSPLHSPAHDDLRGPACNLTGSRVRDSLRRPSDRARRLGISARAHCPRLLVAWSWDGFVLSIGALAAFLLHQPLKTAVRDRMAGRRAPRSIWAERFAVVYALVAAASLGWIAWTAPSRVVVALLIFAPLAAIQLAYDLRGKSRDLIPEIAGAAALAGIAVAIAMLDGWMFGPAMGLWGILVAAIRAVDRLRSRATAARAWKGRKIRHGDHRARAGGPRRRRALVGRGRVSRGNRRDRRASRQGVAWIVGNPGSVTGPR